MSRILVVGSGGQDGSLLTERLAREGDPVLGIDSGTAFSTEAAPLRPVDIQDRDAVLDAVESYRPDTVYYLAAHHGSSEDDPGDDPGELLRRSHAVHVTGLVHFLEALRLAAPRGRLFYAASSRVFGEPADSPQDERTPVAPACAYGITKAAGMQICRLYRGDHGIRASVGILYNHESPLRPPGFVSQRIVQGALQIRRGRAERLVLGDLAARVDWGWAPDFVDAMIRIARREEAEDFVVATGELHSVGELVAAVFGLAGLDPSRHVVEDRSRIRRRSAPLVGNSAKLRTATGWRPTVPFEAMVRRLWEAACAAAGESA